MNDDDLPFSNGESNGGRVDRGPDGKFLRGNPGGPGNPRAKFARQLSDRNLEAVFKTCDPARLLKAWDAVMKRAETGDTAAMKLIIEFIDGPAGQRFANERIVQLEESIAILKEKQNEQHL